MRASAQGGKSTVDRVWTEFKSVCNALRAANNDKERLRVVQMAQTFMSDEVHRQYVHKWRSWGLLLLNLLQLVMADVDHCGWLPSASAASLTVVRGSSGNKKRKLKSAKKAPKITWWSYLRSELAMAHTTNGPLLHLDPNGRECLRQLFAFAMDMVSCDTIVDSNDMKAIDMKLEKEAWLTIQMLVQYRVYCAVLDQKQLQNVLELALASIDHESALQTSSSEIAVRASVVQRVLSNCAFDLTDWLQKLLPYFADWFDSIGVGATRSLDDVAPVMLDAITHLTRTYFGSIGPLLLTHGANILHYVQRSWKRTKYHLRRHHADFICQFLALYSSHQGSLFDEYGLEPVRLVKDLKVLLTVMLDPKELQQVLLHSKPTRLALSSAVNTGNISSLYGSLLNIEDSVVSLFACAADVMYRHDCLVAELIVQQAETKIAHTEGADSAQAKKARLVDTSMAWETLVERLCVDFDTENDFAASSLSSLPDRKRVSEMQRLEAQENQRIPFMILFLTVLCRHGDYYLQNRVGDIMLITKALTDALVSKEIQQQQYLALQSLTRLVMLAVKNPETCGDILNEYWPIVWRYLLRPDLPYGHATANSNLAKDHAGEAVLGLLTLLAAYKLVPLEQINSSQEQLWNLPAFCNDGSGMGSSGVRASAQSGLSYAPFCLLHTLLQCIELPEHTPTRMGTEMNDEIMPLADVSPTIMDVRSRLLQSVFDHLEAKIYHDAGGAASNDDTGFDPFDETSPIICASVLSMFLRPRHPRSKVSHAGIPVSSLIRNLSGFRFLCTSRNSYALNGFGVGFCMQEWGMEQLSYTNPIASVVGPDIFPLAVTELVRHSEQIQDINIANGGVQDCFKRIEIPSALLQDFFSMHNEVLYLNSQLSSNMRIFPSSSKRTVISTQKHIAKNFVSLLDDLSNKICLVDIDLSRLLGLLYGSLNIGLILAAMIGNEDIGSSTHSDSSNLDCKSILKKSLIIVSDHFESLAIDQSQLKEAEARRALTLVQTFHTLILVLQGGSALARMNHPSADPVELRILADIRPSIRKIITCIEMSLERTASGSEESQSTPNSGQITPAQSTSMQASSLSRGWDWESAPSSQSRSTATPPVHRARDAFDDTNATKISMSGHKSVFLQNALSLWNFRILLLLKKDGGLKTIRKVALELPLSPDYLLAVAVLLCGVPGCDSLELFVKILAAASDEIREAVKSSMRENMANLCFDCEILTALKLCGLMYERRKHSHNEEIPDLLLQTARSYLDKVISSSSKGSFRLARKVETECLEVFFRLNLDVFGDFVNVSMERLVDSDIGVRLVASQGLQTLFYMYPDGGVHVFGDIYKILLHVVPSAFADDEKVVKGVGHTSQPMDVCLTLLLSLYICACSSHEVVSEVIAVFARLGSIPNSVYAKSSIALLHLWLNKISSHYSYATVSRMLQDHFSYMWSQFLASNSKMIKTSEFTLEMLLDRFPMALLLGMQESDAITMYDQLSQVVDSMFPVAILHDFLHGDGDNEMNSNAKLVDGLANYFFALSEDDSTHTTQARMLTEEQLITDMFGLSFVLQASPSSKLHPLASQILAVAEDRASTNALNLSHLGHVVMKMARFVVLSVMNEGEEAGESDLWLKAMVCMKNKYSDFDWAQMNISEMLGEMYVLLLRSKYCDSMAEKSVNCFRLFVTEVEYLFDGDFVLQRLLLHICFQAIQQLSSHRKDVARKLTHLVRVLCEKFMQNANVFGRYLNFVVQEIAEILALCNLICLDRQTLTLDGDDKGNLEWVIFAICNNIASGLDKYITDIDMILDGVSPSLDKLNGIIGGNRKAIAPDDISTARDSLSDPQNSSERHAVQQIELFLSKECASGVQFYNPLPFVHDSMVSSRRRLSNLLQSQSSVSPRVSSSTWLSLVKDKIIELREAVSSGLEDSELNALLAKLSNTLFYLSSGLETKKSVETAQAGADVLVSIADVLGEIGALDENEYDLSPGATGNDLSRLYQKHFHRGQLGDVNVSFQFAMYEQLLVYLSSLLFNKSESTPDIVEDAISTLTSILSLDEGSNALSVSKNGELKGFASLFQNCSPSTWSTVVTMNTIQTSQSNHDSHKELWRSTNTMNFEKWVCSLSSVLASQSGNEVLKACTVLLKKDRELAVFLFPYLLCDVLRSEDPMETSATLKAIVQDGVRNILSAVIKQNSSTASQAGNETVLELVQLLIHSINFARETEKASFVESNGKSMESTRSSLSTSRGDASEVLNTLGYGCLFDIDLLDIAVAANLVKMPYSAMQYVEMFLEQQFGQVKRSAGSLKDSKMDDQIRSILVDAYSFDGNVDGLYGVNDGVDFAAQLVTYNSEGMHIKALPIYDALLQSQKSQVSTAYLLQQEGMLLALRNLGYQHLLEGYVNSQTSEAAAVSHYSQEKKYELAWKNLQWDVAVTAMAEQDGNGNSLVSSYSEEKYSHQRILYQLLKSFAHEDFSSLQYLTISSKEQILRTLRLSLMGFESTQDSYIALFCLHCIREIEEAATFVMACEQPTNRTLHNIVGERMPIMGHNQGLDTRDRAGFESLYEVWKKRHSQIRHDGDMTERLLALEEVLIQIAGGSSRHHLLSKLYLSQAALCRKTNQVAVAYKALMVLQQMDDKGQLSIPQRMEWRMEKAKLLWSQQEDRGAISIAKQIHFELSARVEDPSTSIEHIEPLQLLQISVLTLTGTWLASQRCESSQVIIEQYFERATKLADALQPTLSTTQAFGHGSKAHIVFAEYMRDMYLQVNARVRSHEWLAGKRVAEAREREREELMAMAPEKQAQNRAHIHALSQEVQNDRKERSKVEASVNQFLKGALRSYGKGLALSPKAELDVVFRVLSLWFSNQLNGEVNRVVQDIIESVPSYKFVPLSYQIISRIDSNVATTLSRPSPKFQEILSILVLKLCQEHPHHALVQLIALKNSGDVEGKGALEFRTNVGDAKSEGAKSYVEKLRRTDQSELLESLDILSNAYIQLALFDTTAFHKQKQKIPLSKVQIHGIPGIKSQSFDNCLRATGRSRANRAVMPPVLTCTISPRADMNYSGVVRVLSFEPMFSITDSGIHRPKIIYCYGSDGRQFKQLVKGQDDTRQDLVIEQVFETVNHFLKDDQETSKRKLRLRTYKVVPLSPIAGVLEWVNDTIPWGSYLVNKTSKQLAAHERYHPQEWKHMNCRSHLRNSPDKLAAYKEIEAHFTPVFHHFFLEKYPDASVWYHRRLAYAQSVAVTSIVGYIVGIGDRHSQNILIHEPTAELVHIDFGVVFDQGMALVTPETVPFRLTRDIVDGMGVSGCEGVFTRCCEATLQVLRKKSASVVTILEVFVHDPLYRWTLSPLKALRIQEEEKGSGGRRRDGGHNSRSGAVGDEGDSGSNNDAATRALIRVKQKLDGYEDPNGSALSIEGQVKQLISAAQNPHNLSKLFPGWAPWL